MLEPLETRRLLAAVVSAKGTLAVSGTTANDIIQVRRDPASSTKIEAIVNGASQKFDLVSVKRIELYGLAGADRLTLNDALAIISRKGATLFGAAGNDTLVGGLAAVRFDGGSENDSLVGSSKADTMLGGAGNDTVIGGKGDDQILGNEGTDSVRGSAGHDRIYGDQGNDTLFGEDGDDTIGGDGEDRLYFQNQSDPVNHDGDDSLNGGNGSDWLVGGRQSSTLDDDNGQDTLTGGAGNDILDARGWDGTDNEDDTLTDRAAGDLVPMENHSRQATAQEIAEGEDAYAVHEHALLEININDNGVMRKVLIQAGIGDFVSPTVANTSPAFHVHTGDEGTLHMHDLEPHTFTLGEFFRGMGVTMSRNHIGRYVAGAGRTLSIVVEHGDGGEIETITDPYNYVVMGHDNPGLGDLITITYA